MSGIPAKHLVVEAFVEPLSRDQASCAKNDPRSCLSVLHHSSSVLPCPILEHRHLEKEPEGFAAQHPGRWQAALALSCLRGLVGVEAGRSVGGCVTIVKSVGTR